MSILRHHDHHPNTQRAANQLRFGKKIVAALTATALTAGLGYGGVRVYEESQYHEVGTTEVSIDEGDTPIGAVKEGVEDLAKVYGFGLNEVSNIVGAGKNVYGEIKDQTGSEVIEPGTLIEVKVSKNGFDKLKAEADPVAESPK